MNDLEKIKEEIQKLNITYIPVNYWENTKYKPYTLKMIELDKVLKIIESLQNSEKK